MEEGGGGGGGHHYQIFRIQLRFSFRVLNQGLVHWILAGFSVKVQDNDIEAFPSSSVQ